MTYGAPLIGELFAQEISRLVIKYLKGPALTSNSVSQIASSFRHFIKHIANYSEEIRPKCLSDLTAEHFSSYIHNGLNGLAEGKKNKVNRVLKKSKHYDSWGISSISTKPSTEKVDYSDIDADELEKAFGENEYSDTVLTQLLAFCLYVIQDAQSRWQLIQEQTKESLGDDFLEFDDISVKNPKLLDMLIDKDNGHQKLMNNLLAHYNHDLNGRKRYRDRDSDYSNFLFKLAKIRNNPNISEAYKGNDVWIKTKIFPLIEGQFMVSNAEKSFGSREGTFQPQMHPFLTCRSVHHELAIFIYALITTGINAEVIQRWKRHTNCTPWYENYDAELGLGEDADKKVAQVVVMGMKKRTAKAPPKPIGCPIKVNSPLFQYLKFLDETRDPNREYIFSSNVFSADRKKGFLQHFELLDIDGKRLANLKGRKIRKAYGGHKLMQLLEDVKSSGELVEKLRVALNHSSFDTTFFSYLLKSGTANLVLNAGIVALTTDLLESAVKFQGKIQEDSSKRIKEQERYLCDCTDPANPTHNIPVAKRCTKYDMCLGCERSEVYSEHLPNIFYRIIQMEEYKASTDTLSNGLLDDRIGIAKDTIEKFRLTHADGETLTVNAYEVANKALLDGEDLLPPVIQF